MPIIACVLRSTIDHQTSTDFVDQTFVGAAMTTKSTSAYTAFTSNVAIKVSAFFTQYLRMLILTPHAPAGTP